MEEMYSKKEDVEFLSQELNKKLGNLISINKYSLGQEVLTGKIVTDISKSARFEGVDFNIKYSKGEFLRINVGEIYLINSYKEKEEAIKLLTYVISNINLTHNQYLGQPNAYYQIEINGFYIPFCDWVWKYKDEYLDELKNNTMYDDANIENLILFEEPQNIICKRK